MGSTIRVNDTLQITPNQGFPIALDILQHLMFPLSASQFSGQVFSFWSKEGIRNFQQSPVQNFLVENREGKHIYWGLITMLSVTHDYLKNMTSGQYQIYTIYTHEQMKMAARMTGIDSQLDYFAHVNKKT